MSSRKLKSNLVGHACKTVPEIGLGGRANREWLSLAEEAGFDTFLTTDRGIDYEEDRHKRKLAIILVRGKSNGLADLLPHVSDILTLLRSIGPGQLVRVSG